MCNSSHSLKHIIISTTVKLWTYTYNFTLMKFNLRNVLPKCGRFLLVHHVYKCTETFLIIPNCVILQCLIARV